MLAVFYTGYVRTCLSSTRHHITAGAAGTHQQQQRKRQRHLYQLEGTA